jgi:hypothetical protein
MLSRSIEAVNRRFSAVSLWCEPVMIGIVCRCLLRCFKNSMQQAEMSHGMCELGVHLLFIGFPDGVHWQEKGNMRRILHSL